MGCKAETAQSAAGAEFARVMRTGRPSQPALPHGRLNLRPDDVKNGLGRLVLVLVKLLHELLQRQALRLVEAGSLTRNQVERLGLTLMRQAQEIDRLRQEFGLSEEDLNLDLGPIGKLL